MAGWDVKVSHTLEGLGNLHDFIKKVEDISGKRPPLVLESTGHYHTPIVQYFEENGQPEIFSILINLIIQTGQFSLRRYSKFFKLF